MSQLVGIRVYQEYAWEYEGIRHLAIHGHQFDRFVSRNRVLSTFLSALHLGMQKFAFGRTRMIGFLERFDTAWLRLSANVARGALAHARSKQAQRIFCGHTHEARSLKRDGVEYYNTGSWTQESSTYVAIDHQGVRICEHKEIAGESLDRGLTDVLEFDFEDFTA